MPVDPPQVELAVLHAVADLHPVHLTPDGLVKEISGDQDEAEEIKNAISELTACGLFESIGDVVAPTRAGLKTRMLVSL